MGLDIYFHKCNRGDIDRYEQAHKEWAGNQPESSKINNDDFDKLPEEKKESIKKEVNEWYKKEPSFKDYGIEDVGYFRKVNFLMAFFAYTGNCEFKEIAKCELEDLKERTDKLMACKPVRRVKNFYRKNEKLVKALASLTDEEKANLDILAFLTELGCDFSNSETDQFVAKAKERSIHDVKVILGIEKPVEGEDYRVEKIYRKADQALAEDLLPSQSGFFFGNTEYNHYYWEDVKEVNEWVADLLNDLSDDEQVLMYCWW